MTLLTSPNRGFRIPTIIGLILVIIVAGLTIALFESFTKTPTNAGASSAPQNVAVTNVGEKGFTVIWTTPDPATGMISVLSPKISPSTAYDERDTPSRSPKPYLSHSVSVRSLVPGTTYTFAIISNGKKHLDNGKPFRATTAVSISGQGSGLEPAFGEVHDSAGTPLGGAIMLITIEGGQRISTVTSPSGAWLVSLRLVRNAALSQYISSENRLTESIRAIYGVEESSAITDTLNDAPVPTMRMGKTYDFRKQQAAAISITSPPGTAQSKPESPSVLGDSTPVNPSSSRMVALATPAQNAALTSALPMISGTGIPGNHVTVVLGITNPVSVTTKVGIDGIWRVTPNSPLGAGKQSVTATSADVRGKPIAITHTFTILKSGTQVLGEATPSASLTPTFSPTPVATPTAEPSATPTPQLAGEPVPTSGTGLPTILILLLGLTLLAGGFAVSPR